LGPLRSQWAEEEAQMAAMDAHYKAEMDAEFLRIFGDDEYN
jgi:hypothetical protein